MKNLFEVLKEWERHGKPSCAYYSYPENDTVIVTKPIKDLFNENTIEYLFEDLTPTEYIPPAEHWVEDEYCTIALMHLLSGQEVECQHLTEPEPWGSPDEVKVKNLKHYRWRRKEKAGSLSNADWNEQINRAKKYQ